MGSDGEFGVHFFGGGMLLTLMEADHICLLLPVLADQPTSGCGSDLRHLRIFVILSMKSHVASQASAISIGVGSF